jgi:hypothetical protein
MKWKFSTLESGAVLVKEAALVKSNCMAFGSPQRLSRYHGMRPEHSGPAEQDVDCVARKENWALTIERICPC